MKEKLKKPVRLLEVKAFVPSRTVAGYSNEEKLGFETAFKPIAEKYRRRERLGRKLGVALAISFITFFTVGVLYPQTTKWLLFAGVIIWLIGFKVSNARVICPACSNTVNGGFGSYCPQCGKVLKRDSMLNINNVSCTWCAIKCRNVRGRHCRIRICTYCGVKLEPIGI